MSRNVTLNKTLRELTLPGWANWLAQDADGTWWAYEFEPNEAFTGWYENETGRSMRLIQETPGGDWRTTLVHLPDDGSPED